MAEDFEFFGDISILGQSSCGEVAARRELPSWRWIFSGCHVDWGVGGKIEILGILSKTDFALQSIIY